MDLKEFTKQTLLQIVEGTNEASEAMTVSLKKACPSIVATKFLVVFGDNMNFVVLYTI